MTELTELVQESILTPAKKAENLLKLREAKRQIEERIELLNSELLEAMRATDSLSIKTSSFTISRAKRVTPFVENYKALKQDLDEKRIPYTTKEVFGDEMAGVFRQAVKEGRQLDGLSSRETEYITIKTPKE